MQDIFLMINFGDRAHASGAVLSAYEQILREHGGRFKIERSRSKAHGAELLDEAVRERYAAFIVGGGDGTLNVALNHPRARDIALGVLPLGTVNALAQTLGLRKADPVDALRRVLTWRPRPVQIGRAVLGSGESAAAAAQRFICFASVGFDAEIVRITGGWLKKTLRQGAFAIQGARVAARPSKLPEFIVSPPGQAASFAARALVLSNVQNYAGKTVFTTGVAEPRFQALAWRGRSLPGLLGDLARVSLAKPGATFGSDDPRGLWGIQPVETELVITSEQPVAYQLDGEPCGQFSGRLALVRESPGQLFLLPD